MNLASQLRELEEETRGLTTSDRAVFCCRLAKQFEKAGEYDAACESLAEFWPGRTGIPKIKGLDQPRTAEILLRVGTLAGWLGSAHQAEGGQETAKNLITQSVEMFQELGESARVAEARSDLALCYWREGAFDEARIVLKQVISELGDSENQIRATALIRSAIVEKTAARHSEPLSIYKEAAPLIESTSDHALQ